MSQDVSEYVTPAQYRAEQGQGKRHKYGAQQATYGGVRYPSRAEADYARALDLRLRAGEIAYWGRADPIELVPGKRGERIDYRPDFVVMDHDWQLHFVEVKGFETEAWKLKARLLKARYPALRLLIVSKRGERWL